MLWANGNEVDVSPEKDLHRYLEYLMTGQKFYTFNPSDDSPRVNTVEMVDKYIPGNEYVFVIERTPEYYKMSVTGDFFYGGHKTYEHTKAIFPRRKMDTPIPGTSINLLKNCRVMLLLAIPSIIKIQRWKHGLRVRNTRIISSLVCRISTTMRAACPIPA